MRSGRRKLNLLRLLTIILLLVLPFGPASGAGPESNPENNPDAPGKTAAVGEKTPAYHDCALFIAGMGNPHGPLAAYENDPAWARYAAFINRSWERFAKRHLDPMREWASRELGAARTATVFYPFSGPDFANVHTLFPQAKTYLMIALEPAGEIPDFAATDANHFLSHLERSLYDLLQLNFFITEKLKNSVVKSELKGVLPVLLFFLAREKTRVLDVRYWVMGADGAIEESPGARPPAHDPGDVAGVRIDFARGGAADRQTLYYFRFNLRNSSLQNNEKFVSFLKGFGPVTTFAKAASYLMHRPGFSEIREFILNQSLFVLASDSAIPVRHFDRAVWNLRFFGNYTNPITLFRCFRQKDLAEIYQNGAEVSPLPFGIDYRHRLNTSNLMFASKKLVLAAGEAK